MERSTGVRDTHRVKSSYFKEGNVIVWTKKVKVDQKRMMLSIWLKTIFYANVVKKLFTNVNFTPTDVMQRRV